MSVRPVGNPPLSTPSEMALLVAQAGLSLNAGQMADLALAWRQLAGLVVRIPRDRPLSDDQAYVFHVPPPGATGGTAAAKTSPGKVLTPKAGVVAEPTKAPSTGAPAAAKPQAAVAREVGKARAPAAAKPQAAVASEVGKARAPAKTPAKAEIKSGAKVGATAAARKRGRPA